MPTVTTDYIQELERRLQEVADSKPSIPEQYEVDQKPDPEFPPLYRVWHGMKLIGTFYQTSQGWTANPHYRSQARQLCADPDQARDLIIACYES